MIKGCADAQMRMGHLIVSKRSNLSEREQMSRNAICNDFSAHLLNRHIALVFRCSFRIWMKRCNSSLWWAFDCFRCSFCTVCAVDERVGKVWFSPRLHSTPRHIQQMENCLDGKQHGVANVWIWRVCVCAFVMFAMPMIPYYVCVCVCGVIYLFTQQMRYAHNE